MGSRSSSNAGSGGRENQGSWSRRDSGILRSEDEDDQDVDLAQVLAYLLRRGQFHLMQGGRTGSARVFQAVSDSDDDTDSAWEGRLGDQYKPPVDLAPDTRDLEHNEIKTRIQLATGRLRPGRPDRSIPKLLGQRERGLCHNSSFSAGECSQIVSHFLPNHLTVKDTYLQKAFCGIYSCDGQLFMSACQDQRIRLYDCAYGAFRNFRSIKARDVGWSVLDVAFTPDRTHFLYSSWSDYIHLCNIYGETQTQTALDLRPDERRFAVFSLAVSSDGREVLGGANYGCVYVFDMEQNKQTLKIEAHEDDVNAVAFADNSSHIVFSGGDDAICKVWDRRTMREDDPQPVGILAGHQDGITFIDSKGDARYLISNSKDQTIKLWDIRKFSGQEGLEASRHAVTQQIWDYRWQQVPKKARRKSKLPGDTSLMTYRGHGVLHTLIRCRFSPPHSTGQQYIYSGCSTGRVVVYDLLSGLIVKKLINHQACVRDVSWHPYEEKIVSSSKICQICLGLDLHFPRRLHPSGGLPGHSPDPAHLPSPGPLGSGRRPLARRHRSLPPDREPDRLLLRSRAGRDPGEQPAGQVDLSPQRPQMARLQRLGSHFPAHLLLPADGGGDGHLPALPGPGSPRRSAAAPHFPAQRPPAAAVELPAGVHSGLPVRLQPQSRGSCHRHPVLVPHLPVLVPLPVFPGEARCRPLSPGSSERGYEAELNVCGKSGCSVCWPK